MRHRLPISAIILLALTTSAFAQVGDGGSKADTEQAIQDYLAIWSSDKSFDAATVERFYAPHVVYYGKSFSRAQVLKDKDAYTRQWPIRHYHEVPGSFAASCDVAKTLCRVKATMSWHRVGRTGKVSDGRARVTFDFVPVEAGRKIARESAHIL